MTASTFSLVSLTVAFLALVLWTFSKRTRERWDQASRLPFDVDEAAGSSAAESAADAGHRRQTGELSEGRK